MGSVPNVESILRLILMTLRSCLELKLRQTVNCVVTLCGKLFISPCSLNISLAGKVFLATYFSHSACWIYHGILFWPVKFLWIDLLLTLFVFACKLGISFPLVFQDSFLISVFCKLMIYIIVLACFC